jgi:16S rRNA (guanine527-N7)-methyltransferase
VSPDGRARGPEDFESLLDAGLTRFDLTSLRGSVPAVARYLIELDRWRERINLTGKLSTVDLAEHALESLLGTKLIADGARVIDVGSGAGFPSIPIAIARPDLALSLVEPRGKKAAFLRHVIRTLPLDNVHVLQARVEEIRQSVWSVATTRALGALPKLSGLAALLAPSGLLVAWTAESEGYLVPGFRFENALKVPSSERKVIAALRRI